MANMYTIDLNDNRRERKDYSYLFSANESEACYSQIIPCRIVCRKNFRQYYPEIIKEYLLATMK